MKKKRIFLGLLQGTLFLVALFFGAYNAAALTSGEDYTVSLSKVNSDGTTTDLENTTATADADGKISFTFSNVPTSPSTNFLVLTVTDSLDTVVRKSFVPAPPDGETGELGANDLSTVQTDMILAALEGAGTDDPIVVAYGLILTRSPDLTDAEVQSIATIGRLCILGGFETMLTNNGVSAEQLATFKEKLIYNQPDKDLSNFTALFKSAVDNPNQASDDMSLAAGLISDIFIDAGVASGIDLSLILAAHEAAGDVFDGNADAVAAAAQFGADTINVIDQAMTNFHTRISAMKFKAASADAFSTLNADDAQVARFETAVQTMMSDMQNLDKQYGQYYEDPASMTEAIRNEMDVAYSLVFSTFQTAIAATDAEIDEMRTGIATALGVTVADLPADVGTYQIWEGDAPVTVNWPIPQVVATNWVASVLSAGGSLVYARDAVMAAQDIPANMAWLNNANYPADPSGAQRTTYADVPDSFAALMQMQEDIQIVEMTKNYIYDPSNAVTAGDPSAQERQDALTAYADNVGLIVESLSGTTDGSTAISSAQKEALAAMMEHPEF